LVELFTQYRVVQACARAEGNNNSSAALLSRPRDVRMVIKPFCSPAGTAAQHASASGEGPCRCLE
jgi:hypothetical protein